MSTDIKQNLPQFNNGTDPFIKDISSYPQNNDEYLPDWFRFDYYNDLSKIDNKSKWAMQFAIRNYYMDRKEFLSVTGGVSYKGEFAELIWRNGVYQSNSIARSKSYIDGLIIHILKQNQGTIVFEPDEKLELGALKQLFNNIGASDTVRIKAKGEKESKILSSIGAPTKSLYQTVSGKTCKHEFSSKENCKNYKKSYDSIFHNSANFLVNLKMPTSKIVEEIERQIIEIKAQRHIVEYDESNKSFTESIRKKWAQSLAVWDLWNAGVESRIIINRVAALFHNEIGYKLELGVKDELADKLYENLLKKAKIFIESDWRKLSGNLDF